MVLGRLQQVCMGGGKENLGLGPTPWSKRGVQTLGRSNFGPNVKSLHRGPKGGGGLDPLDPPLDPLLLSDSVRPREGEITVFHPLT